MSDLEIVTDIGDKIIDLRRKYGMPISSCLIDLDISIKDYNTLLKKYKSFRKQMKVAREYALDWWISKIGECSISNKGDINDIKEYIKIEFDVDMNSINNDKDINLNITVRAKE